MEDLDNDLLQIPVYLQMLKKCDSEDTSKRKRVKCGTVYFPEGTTANTVCMYVTEKQKAKLGPTGIWLLQSRPRNQTDKNENLSEINDEVETEFENIRDSKHQLTDGYEYIALYYTGPDIFLIQ